MSKILTAKQARKQASKSFKALANIKQVNQLINTYSNLGFTNMNIDINPNILVELEDNLVKRGYRINAVDDGTFIMLEIEW